MLEKIKNIKLRNKIVILLGITILTIIFNYVFFNYQLLKLDETEQNYNVDYQYITDKDTKIEDENKEELAEETKIQINLQGKYVKDLLIQYESNEDTKVEYEATVANNYGIYKQYVKSDKCLKDLNLCGVKLNKKTDTIEITFNSSTIKILDIHVDNTIRFNWSTFILICLLSNLIASVILFADYFYEKKHILTFLLCFSFGLIFLFNTHNMTSTTLDDMTHYAVANTLKENKYGKSISDYYLENYKSVFYHQDTYAERIHFQNFLNENAKVVNNYNNNQGQLYVLGRLCYIPMALVLKIVADLGGRLTIAIFIARFVQLLIYSLVVSFAVKLIPNHKLLAMFCALIPQSLFLASNFNYDPTVTAFLLLSFAAFANEFANKDRKIKLSNVLIFILAGLFGSFPKLIYVPFLFLFLLLPKEKFKNSKNSKICKVLVVFISAIILSTFILPTVTTTSGGGDARGGNVSISEQKKIILTQPVSFIKTFWNEAVLNTPERLVGPSTMGLLSYYGGMTNDISYYLIIITLMLAFFSEKNQIDINWKNRIFMLGTYILIICFIWLSMYLSFTPIGEDVINGVQARYFIPFILPILYTFQSSKWMNKINDKNIMILCSIFYLVAFGLFVYNLLTAIYFI